MYRINNFFEFTKMNIIFTVTILFFTSIETDANAEPNHMNQIEGEILYQPREKRGEKVILRMSFQNNYSQALCIPSIYFPESGNVLGNKFLIISSNIPLKYKGLLFDLAFPQTTYRIVRQNSKFIQRFIWSQHILSNGVSLMS